MERIAIISKIRLIISDIDGTILTSNHQVDDQLIEVMPELEKAKIPFVLASAHSPLGMPPIAHKLGLHDKELQDTVSDSKPSIHKLLLIDEPEVYPGPPPKTPKHGFSTDSLLLIQR